MPSPIQPKQAQRRRLALIFAQAAVSVLLIGWLLSRFDFREAVQVVMRGNAGLIVAGFVSAIAVLGCLTARFGAVLAKGGLSLPFTQTLQVVWVGQFWNFFLPGSTGGDLYRFAAVTACHPRRRTEVVFAVLADRLVATALLAMAACVSAFMLPLSGIENLGWASRLPGFVRPILAGCAVALAATIGAMMVPSLRRRGRGLLSAVIEKVKMAATFLRPDRGLVRVVGWGIAGHLFNFASFYFFARAIGMAVRFSDVCLILPVVVLLLIIPLSINGHGVREVLLVFFLTALAVQPPPGIPLAEGVLALSIVGLSSDFILGLVGGGFFFLSRWRSNHPPKSDLSRAETF